MDIKKLDDNFIDCIEIHHLCIILNEYLENYIDHEPIIDNAHSLSKAIRMRIETLKDNLDEIVSEEYFSKNNRL